MLTPQYWKHQGVFSFLLVMSVPGAAAEGTGDASAGSSGFHALAGSRGFLALVGSAGSHHTLNIHSLCFLLVSQRLSLQILGS
jgi:hypothetical protein